MENTTIYTNHLHTTDGRWFAVYAQFKREKIVERQLRQKGVECYLPLQKVTRLYQRKRRTVELPLISGYIFVRITKDQYLPVLETEHVVRFVRFSKNLISIPEAEIDLIRRVVGEGFPLEVEQTSMAEGDAVEIVAGNLTGLSGRLISREGKKQVAIELTNIGYSLRLTVDPSILIKTSRPAASY